MNMQVDFRRATVPINRWVKIITSRTVTDEGRKSSFYFVHFCFELQSNWRWSKFRPVLRRCWLIFSSSSLLFSLYQTKFLNFHRRWSNVVWLESCFQSLISFFSWRFLSFGSFGAWFVSIDRTSFIEQDFIWSFQFTRNFIHYAFDIERLSTFAIGQVNDNRNNVEHRTSARSQRFIRRRRNRTKIIDQCFCALRFQW